MKRQHPIAILRYTTKNFWLLLIPLVRGVMIKNFDIYQWLKTAYFDILILIVIFLAAYIRWRCVKYEFRQNSIKYTAGVFARADYEIPYSIISSVSTKRIMWLRPTKAVSVYIDSETQSAFNAKKDTDIYIISDVKTLEAAFKAIPQKSDSIKLNYEASKWNLILFSLVFSSTLSGALFLGTLFIQGSKIIREQISEKFLIAVSDLTTFASRFVTGVTPAAVGVSIILLIGWLYSFSTNLLRHINFTIRREGRNIFISNGFFSAWRYYINTDNVNYADIRQNLFMKLFKVMSVNVSCSGYGKAKNEIPVLVPVTTRKRVIVTMQMLLPLFPLENITIKPKQKNILRFIGAPIALIILVFTAGLIAKYFFIDWLSAILFFIIMIEIPCVYMLIVKIFSYYTTGIGKSKSHITLSYCSYFKFHNIIIPIKRIAMIKISQNFFQRKNNSCDLIIYAKAEFTKSHKVKGLNITDILKLLNDINIQNEYI